MHAKYAFFPEYQNSVYLYNLAENVQKAVIFLLICDLGRSCCLGWKKGPQKF